MVVCRNSFSFVDVSSIIRLSSNACRRSCSAIESFFWRRELFFFNHNDAIVRANVSVERATVVKIMST